MNYPSWGSQTGKASGYLEATTPGGTRDSCGEELRGERAAATPHPFQLLARWQDMSEAGPWTWHQVPSDNPGHICQLSARQEQL